MFDMFVYQRLYSVYSMLITTMKAVYIDSQEMYPININSSALPNTIFIMIPFSMPQSVCPSHTLPNISYYSYPTYIYYIHVYMYIHVYNIHTYVYTIPYVYIYIIPCHSLHSPRFPCLTTAVPRWTATLHRWATAWRPWSRWRPGSVSMRTAACPTAEIRCHGWPKMY